MLGKGDGGLEKAVIAIKKDVRVRVRVQIFCWGRAKIGALWWRFLGANGQGKQAAGAPDTSVPHRTAQKRSKRGCL